MTTAREIAIAQLRVDEGLRLKAYQCTAGKWTLGYGRNLEAKGVKPALAKLMTCTKETAEAWLAEDVDAVIRSCEHWPIFRMLNAERQAVIINMVFNMGALRVSSFSQMWLALQAGNFAKAKIEMLDSNWSRQVGARAKRLADKMASGV